MFELRKIGIVRRASAWLLDAILLSVLAVGFMFLISLMCNFDGEEKTAREYYDAWEGYRKEWVQEISEHYGFTYTAQDEENTEYTIQLNGQSATLNDVLTKLTEDEARDERMAAAYEAYGKLPPISKVNGQYQYVHNLLFMMISVGLALGYLILEFVIPLFLKNGQTVGKKVFSICLVRPNCVKVSAIAVFARTVIGKYAVEAMFPILLAFMFFFGGLGLLAIILFAAIILLNIILFFATKNRTPIHDILAYTVVVDMKLQMIFASDDELNEKKALAKKQFIEQEKNI